MGDIDTEAGEFWVENPFRLAESGHNLSAFERNRLFLNTGGLEFIDASFGSGADLESDSRSAVPADFNRDGRVYILVSSAGGGPLRIFQNISTTGNNWIRFELEGTASYRSAIGTRVILEIGDRPGSLPGQRISGPATMRITDWPGSRP